ncbi:hypothetical protein CCACVL1_16514 [Corchorus capsularis]|uniref:Transmembrane protein n=1 Tax=Corchorus capsularis TaxID=210143 RepID=A0A1R3HWU2_COCAP|nr:hypothetical protein CCACVL1_16514 [Corchorus capsularis]
MAHFSKITVFLIAIIVIAFHIPCFQARKTLSKEKMGGPFLEQSMIVNADPKVVNPPSTPTKSGHGLGANEIYKPQHISLTGWSVPSPGVGN